MKKLLIAFIVICIGVLFADPIPIGEGTVTNTSLPMDLYWGYTYSQVIYTADEIGGAVDIENVAWHYNGYNDWTENEVTIYMGHTTLDEFGAYPSWIPVTELTAVYTGPFTVLDFDHWVTVELDNVFAYNGTDNLVIAFDANTAGYPTGGSSCEFFASETTMNRSIYFYSDSNNPDPANPPTGTYRNDNLSEDEARKTGKTMSRGAGVQAYIANIILNNDATLPSGFVNGHVYDQDTNAPIEGATVSVGSFIGTTDASGFYEIEVMIEGLLDVTVTHPDYFPGSGQVTTIFDQTVTLDLYMELNDLQGDQPGTAIVIDAFPYFDTGDTSAGFTNFIGNNSPDVFYTFTNTETLLLDMHTCGSTFDTYLRLYDDTMTQVVSNDDGCSSWPTGVSTASWIAGGDGTIVSPGTYYICVEGFSSYSGYYELTVEELLPPEFGNLEGTVTELDGGTPIEGAVVAAGGVQVTTDASGYYLIEDLETGVYTVTASADGFLPGAQTDVEVLVDQTVTVDFALEIFVDTGDTIEDPIVIDAFPYFMSGDISLYTDYSTGAGLPSSHSGEDVFWMFELTETSTLEFHSCGSEFDTYMHLYDSDLAEVSNNDDGCSTWGSGNTMASWLGEDEGTYTVVVPPGTYYVCNEGYSTNHTNPYFEVHYDILPPPAMGSLEGTVTDAYSGDPISGALITCGDYSGLTDAAGYYLITDILIGDYDAVCTNPRFIGATAPVSITEDVVTTQDFALDINMLEPLNLTANVDGYDVGLEWDEPNFLPTDALHWDSMVNNDAIGISTGGAFTVAARFTPTELSVYDGMIMDNVTVYINDLPDVMTLYVWSGENAANVLLEQAVTPMATSWNHIDLNTPVTIDASTEMWIGYYGSFTSSNPYPAGCDAGPAVAGYGDLLSEDGGATWVSMSQAYDLDYNWNIWGVISDARGEDIVLAQPKAWMPPLVVQSDDRVEYSLAGISENVRDFTGSYNVYKNNELLATVTETSYDDLGLDAGIYEYYVTTVYDEGESEESNHVTVELGSVDVSVNPTELSETLDYGLTSDYTISLTNSGDANFYWTGSIQQQVRYDVPEMTPRPVDKIGDDAEMSPEAMMFETPNMREMFDLIDSFNCSNEPGQLGYAGLEFDGTYFYSPRWNYSDFGKWDIDGNFIGSFEITGVSNVRDLAYDGQYFYGGAAGTTIYKMDFENQTLISTITSPVDVRAIAYDEQADAFWVNNWSTDITLVSRDGIALDSFVCGTYGSFYGFAYDPFTDGGPYLWGFSQDGSGCELVQMLLDTGIETGVTYDVLQDVGLDGDIAGGLFTSADYMTGTFVIGGLVQGDDVTDPNNYIFVYELSPSSVWLSVNPSAGTLAPGTSVDITATFNACELPGLTYYADIVFTDGETAATVAADLTITGSIPTPEITVNPAEFDVVVPVDELATYTLNIGNNGDLDLEYDAEIMYFEGRTVVEAMPQNADYWTGTTDYTSFIQTSLVDATPGYEGWMKFDVSAIPDNAVINSIDCNIYVNATYYPYYSLTPCTLDPMATDAATLANHIVAGNPSGVAYSYNNESSTYAPGAYTYPLGTTATSDLQAALVNDWFAVGVSPRDGTATYYTIVDGWNEANPPSLTIDYYIPINPWCTFDGNMTTNGTVPVGGGADAITVNFDATGLVDGDIMTGQIVIGCNDLYNEEVIVPVTMTVGQPYLYGDVTGDEIIDAFDAANILQYTVGMDPVGAPLPWTWELVAGDVDGNGTPEAYDAALVLQYAVGMINIFPVEARIELPVAEVNMAVENGELIFSTTGNLYGFSVMTETDLISFQEPQVDYLHAVNGNAIALANAEEISGEFLRIPFEKIAESGEFVMTMTANGISTENTYYVEDLESAPAVNAVLGNYPNPFNPSTTIALAVKDDNTPVKVNIYNVKGQLVNSLVDETVASGIYNFEWSGKDNKNRSVSSGVYFYKVKIGSLNETHKMIMLK